MNMIMQRYKSIIIIIIIMMLALVCVFNIDPASPSRMTYWPADKKPWRQPNIFFWGVITLRVRASLTWDHPWNGEWRMKNEECCRRQHMIVFRL